VEISPISGVRSFPAKLPAADAKQWAVFEIEDSARAGDETYSPGGGKSEQEDEDKYEETAAEVEPEPDSEFQPEIKMHTADPPLERKVSFFA
jgi:hypothetical protein